MQIYRRDIEYVKNVPMIKYNFEKVEKVKYL